MTSDNQIRTSRKARVSGKLGGWLIRILGMTLRREVIGNISELNARDQPIIHVMWHNQILAAPYLWRKMYPRRECVVLTSASKDGVVLASAVKVFKLGAVHGSSSRRGAAAIVALIHSGSRAQPAISLALSCSTLLQLCSSAASSYL